MTRGAATVRGGGVVPALAALLVLTGLAIAACRSDTGARSERDQSVGKAEAHGIRVEVEDGNAVVRSLEADSITLWLQAPSVVVHLTTDEPRTLTVNVGNAMPDAELLVVYFDVIDGATLIERTSPTRARWSVELKKGETRLMLGPPDARDREPYRFAVLSDVQEAIPRVGDIYARMNADPSLRFVFSAGDLTENGSREQLEEFERRLGELDIPFYGTLGNHELFTPDVPFHELFGRGSFHFVFKDVHFSLVDSGDGTLDPAVLGWLDGWLEQARNSVHIFATHIPPFDPSGTRSGAFGSRNEAASVVNKLAAANVDLAIYGHVHSLYSFSHAGVPAFISGGGGAIPERFDGINRHFLVVSVDPDRGVQEVSVVRID